MTYSALHDGLHTFRVYAVDGGGNTSPIADWTWRADTLAPGVTTTATPLFSLATTVGLRYAGTDSGSGVDSYDVRYRRAAFNGVFGAYSTPTVSPDWTSITSTSVSLPATKGYTYCMSVRARDKAGNVGTWSRDRCTATALDDRMLTASSGWTRGAGSGYYASTITSTTRTGATLTRSGVQARRVSVLATRCPGCGTIAVYWNGVLVRNISLNSTTTANKVFFSVADFGAVKTGTITIKTLTTGSTRIDGLATSRT